MMAYSPYTSPPLPIPSLEDMNGNNNPEIKEVLDNLPEEINTWNYNQTTSFIVAILSLPKFMTGDIKSFIINKEINGKKLLDLDEDKLMKLGFNRLWCYHLALAIEELIIIAKILKEEKQKLKQPKIKPKFDKNLTLGDKRGNFIVQGLKKYDSFTKPKFSTISLPPNKPFSLPNVELSLMKQFMISETIGLKSDVQKLKEQLKKEINEETKQSSEKEKEKDNKQDGTFSNTLLLSSLVITTIVSIMCYYSFRINSRR